MSLFPATQLPAHRPAHRPFFVRVFARSLKVAHLLRLLHVYALLHSYNMVLTRAQRAQRARHGHEDDNARHARQWSWPLAADEREHDEPVPLRPLRRRNAPRNAPQPPPQPRPPRAVAQAQARAQPVRLLGLPRYWAIALMLLASIASSLLWLPLWRDSALCCPGASLLLSHPSAFLTDKRPVL